MAEVQVITDLADQRLGPYRNMKAQEDELRRRRFIAEGPQVVQRLLESKLEVESVLLPPQWLPQLEEWVRGRMSSPLAFVAELPILETITGYPLYQGVLALARVPEGCSEDALMERLANARGPSSTGALIVAAEGLTSAVNIGGLVRCAAAFGADALVVGPTCVDPYLRRAVRASMGNIFQLPCCRSTDLVRTLQRLTARGVHCLAAVLHSEATPIWEVDLTGSCCLVLGAEGNGLGRGTIEACATRVVLPMHRGVDSLNVVNAASGMLAEISRQRLLLARSSG